MPSYSVINRYVQLGGNKIVIGSDAHSSDRLSGHFRDVVPRLPNRIQIGYFREDGFIGPNELHKADPRSQWPHAVYFRAIYAMWSMTGDEKYLRALERHYMLPDNRYDQDRGAVNIETMLRTALATGNEALRQKALDNYARLQADVADTADFGYRKMLSDAPTGIHGVSLNEIGKLPAIVYAFTGDGEQLRAAEHLYAKILRRRAQILSMAAQLPFF